MAGYSSTMKRKLVPIQLHLFLSALHRLPNNSNVMSLTFGDKGMHFDNFSLKLFMVSGSPTSPPSKWWSIYVMNARIEMRIQRSHCFLHFKVLFQWYLQCFSTWRHRRSSLDNWTVIGLDCFGEIGFFSLFGTMDNHNMNKIHKSDQIPQCRY